MTERIVLADLDDGVRGAVAAARERVAGLHGELIRWGLVVWTAGNVSERVVVTR
ncbi:L-ribulose-5-phosphate 4-epimerase, partial [Actinomyces ruminis]